MGKGVKIFQERIRIREEASLGKKVHYTLIE